MEQYEIYKDSGVEWIGELPFEWTCANLGSIAKQRKSLNKDGEVDNVLSLSYGNVKRRVMDNTGLLPESFNTYNIIEDGDVVLRLTDLQNDQRSLRVGLCSERGIITAAYTTLEPQSIDSRYLFYSLAVFDYWKGFYGLAGGVRQSLTFDGIRGLRFPLPSRFEQQAIADYLDAKTAEIDALVADCEREVELLREYRKAVVSEAVTKGLDPDAPMKDSGVEWIGAIPEGWTVCRVKHSACRLNVGVVIRPSDYFDDEGTVPFLRGLNIREFGFDLSELVKISAASNALLKKSIVHEGDIVVVRDGGVGTAAVIPAELDGANCVSLLELTVSASFNERYVCYCLNSTICSSQIAYMANGTALQHINAGELSEVAIPAPSCEEQQTIAAYLDVKTAEIDSLIESKQQMVEKLREYRKSLISEAVTGKFKVSNP